MYSCNIHFTMYTPSCFIVLYNSTCVHVCLWTFCQSLALDSTCHFLCALLLSSATCTLCCGIAGHVFHDNSTCTYVTCTCTISCIDVHVPVSPHSYMYEKCIWMYTVQSVTLQFHTNLISGVRLANFWDQLGRSTLYIYSSSIRFWYEFFCDYSFQYGILCSKWHLRRHYTHLCFSCPPTYMYLYSDITHQDNNSDNNCSDICSHAIIFVCAVGMRVTQEERGRYSVHYWNCWTNWMGSTLVVMSRYVEVHVHVHVVLSPDHTSIWGEDLVLFCCVCVKYYCHISGYPLMKKQAAYYASVRMRRRHTVVGLCVSHSVILYVCNSVFSEVAIN